MTVSVSEEESNQIFQLHCYFARRMIVSEQSAGEREQEVDVAKNNNGRRQLSVGVDAP